MINKMISVLGGKDCPDEYLNKIFEYRNAKLYNKITRGYQAKNGDEAGCLRGDGYYTVGINGKKYLSHRIIWIINNGEIPSGMQVDHINHNRSDNRIENLRLVTHRQNNMNKTINLNNTSGVIGVNWSESNRKWRARIMVNGKDIHLGRFSEIENAISARKKAEVLYGFHENHGG